jgi:hypothetical protein
VIVATTTCSWRQPQRHLAGEVLDQNADEPLQRAADCAVEHHRLRLGASHPRVDIEGTKPLGQDEVDLRRAALPFTDRWRP